MEYYNSLVNWLGTWPLLLAIVCIIILAAVAFVANYLIKRILIQGLMRLLKRFLPGKDDLLSQHNVVQRLANVVPAMIVSMGIKLVPNLPGGLVKVVENVCSAFVFLALALAVGSALDIFNIYWKERTGKKRKPIKGYVQIIKIIIYLIAAILIIAALIDRSPIILLSGLGAMAAVLMLVFQDTLLSLVASVQISSNGMLQVGDWIEMPQANADGDIIDIALHTVRVQNWDKTITSIPTKKFLTESFKNWRGMTECGGRRIKRSIFIDQNSVHFLSAGEEEHLREFELLKDYLADKDKEIEDWNLKFGESSEVNFRRLTNLGTFRAYINKYLKTHPMIRQRMTLLVRQLSPTSEGIPLELYCFTSTTAWADYENIQSDIFDHLLAIIPEFGLRLFQAPTGAEFASLARKG